MNFLASFYASSIGKKWIVALTGLVLIGYVIGHMIGNLQIFAGPTQINAYATFLHSMPVPLTLIRIFLLVCFVLHIVTTIKLTIENRAAKAVRNEFRASTSPKPAKKTMVVSGLIVLIFVLLHLAHFTVRSLDSRFDKLPRGEYDVHSMVILAFQNPAYSLFYIGSVFLLCMHLSHGMQSVAQTLGINSKKLRDPITYGGIALSWLIFAGFSAVPVAVLTHQLKLVP